MAGVISRTFVRFGWIGISCLIASGWFLVGTGVSFFGGDIDVALGGLVLTLLFLALAIWMAGRRG